MSIFSNVPITCCICEHEMLCSVRPANGFSFETATCSAECRARKEWRRTLSTMDHDWTQASEDAHIAAWREKRKERL